MWIVGSLLWLLVAGPITVLSGWKMLDALETISANETKESFDEFPLAYPKPFQFSEPATVRIIAAGIIVGPPIGVLILGFIVGWIVKGFQHHAKGYEP